MTKEQQVEELRLLIYQLRRNTNGITSSDDIAKVVYDAGYRKNDSERNKILTTAVDATFRGAVLRFAEKLKQCSYCDNCFKDGKWHRYVFVEDIDEIAKEFLESET